MEFTQIYRLNFMRNRFSYVGTLRNQKQFNINDDVFFAYGINGEIARGIIVGVELPPIDNPDYVYKIQLPEELVYNNVDKDDFYKGENFDKITLKCDRIFNSIEEAKVSATKHLQHMYESQKKEIESYFKRFEKP